MSAPSPAPLRLGLAADLLRGLRPVRPSRSAGADTDAAPFSLPPRAPFETFPIEPPTAAELAAAAWEEPELSLHDDLESLLGAVFPHRLAPFEPGAVDFPLPPPGRLLLASAAAAKDAAASLALDLDAAPPAAAYLLLRLRRPVVERLHDAERGGVARYLRVQNFWTREGLHAMGRLRVAGRVAEGAARSARLAPRQAGRYLDYFATHGTHLITRVLLGTELVQVLAPRPERLAALRGLWRREVGGAAPARGALALGLRRHLGSEWLAARGAIVSADGEPVAAEWRDEHGEPCLFSPLRREPGHIARLLERHHAAVPLALGFTPQSTFMETFRADAWKRLLKGALLQRFGPASDVARASRPCGAGGTPALRRNTGETPTPPPPAVFAFHRTLAPDAPPPADASGGVLWAFRLDAASEPEAVGEAPVLRVAAERLADLELSAAEMRGSFILENRAGDERHAVHDGFRFCSPPAVPGAPLVALHGDTRAPSAAALARLSPPVVAALPLAAARLLEPAEEEPARAGLEWLGEIWRDVPERRADRVRVLLLARAPRPEPPPPLPAARVASLAARIVALAGRLRLELRDPRRSADTRRGAIDELNALADELAPAFPDAPAAVPSPSFMADGPLLQAVAGLLDSGAAPAEPWPRVGEGELPALRFWRRVFQVRRALALGRALELAASGSGAGALAWLEAAGPGEAPWPTPAEWSDWPGLVAEALAEAGHAAPPGLAEALAGHAACAAVLAARATAARSRLDEIETESPEAATGRLLALLRLRRAEGFAEAARAVAGLAAGM